MHALIVKRVLQRLVIYLRMSTNIAKRVKRLFIVQAHNLKPYNHLFERCFFSQRSFGKRAIAWLEYESRVQNTHNYPPPTMWAWWLAISCWRSSIWFFTNNDNCLSIPWLLFSWLYYVFPRRNARPSVFLLIAKATK